MRQRTERERLDDAAFEVYSVLVDEEPELGCGQLLDLHRPALDWITGRGSGLGVEPAVSGFGDGVGVGNVGLDVDNRRAVEHVDVQDIEPQVLHALELHHAQAEWVRSVWGTGRECAAAYVAARWLHLRAPAVIEVEPEQHPDVFPAFEVRQCVLEVPALEELDAAAHALGRARLPRCVHPLTER